MPNYIFKGIEIFSLMGLTGYLPESHSPANQIMRKMNRPEPGDADKALNGLMKIGMLVAGSDGKVHPTKEAAMISKILSKPSHVNGIRRMGLSGSTEYFLLKLGELYCLYVPVPGRDLHICRFPLDEQSVKEWFEGDILAGIPSVKEKVSDKTYTLNPVSNMILYSIQDRYSKKAASKTPLEEKDMWFSATMLLAELDKQSMGEKLKLFYAVKQLEKIIESLTDVASFEKQLRLMVEEGILKSKYQGGVELFKYSSFAAEFMDPVLLRDMLLIRKYYPKHEVSAVYLKTNGIFIMVSGADEIVLREGSTSELKEISCI